MATQYNFSDKYIECETWAQIGHLLVLAAEQGYKNNGVNDKHFYEGRVCFYVYIDTEGDMCCSLTSNIVPTNIPDIKYADFIKSATFELTVGENLSEEQMSGIAKQFSRFEAPLMDMEFSVAGKPAADTNNTIEIAGCKGCPLYTRLEQHDYQYCSYPGKEQSCRLFVNSAVEQSRRLFVDMFANCPVKEKALTIKIKQ